MAKVKAPKMQALIGDMPMNSKMPMMKKGSKKGSSKSKSKSSKGC